MTGPLRFSSEPDYATGRVFYTVPRVGLFTFEPGQSVDGWRDDPLRVHMTYGRAPLTWHNGYLPLPDAPVLYGITLVGAAVFTVDPEPSTWGFPCRRSTGSCTSTSVPPRTASRARSIALALSADWMDRPDRQRLLDAHSLWKAPGRLASAVYAHQRALDRLAEVQATVDAASAVVEELVRAAGRLDVLDLDNLPTVPVVA